VNEISKILSITNVHTLTFDGIIILMQIRDNALFYRRQAEAVS